MSRFSQRFVALFGANKGSAAEGSAHSTILASLGSCDGGSAGSRDGGFCLGGKARDEQTALVQCNSILWDWVCWWDCCGLRRYRSLAPCTEVWSGCRAGLELKTGGIWGLEHQRERSPAGHSVLDQLPSWGPAVLPRCSLLDCTDCVPGTSEGWREEEQ